MASLFFCCLLQFPVSPFTHSSISEDCVPSFLELGCWWESLLQRWGRGACVKHRALCQCGREQIPESCSSCAIAHECFGGMLIVFLSQVTL